MSAFVSKVIVAGSIRIWCILWVVALTGCAGLTSNSTKDRMEPGQVEVRRNNDISVHDDLQGREVKFQVSWPSAGESLPVVVFLARRIFAIPSNTQTLLISGFSHGYIVVQPNHLDSPNGPQDETG